MNGCLSSHQNCAQTFRPTTERIFVTTERALWGGAGPVRIGLDMLTRHAEGKAALAHVGSYIGESHAIATAARTQGDRVCVE